jgi:hypothetical protein
MRPHLSTLLLSKICFFFPQTQNILISLLIGEGEGELKFNNCPGYSKYKQLANEKPIKKEKILFSADFVFIACCDCERGRWFTHKIYGIKYWDRSANGDSCQGSQHNLGHHLNETPMSEIVTEHPRSWWVTSNYLTIVHCSYITSKFATDFCNWWIQFFIYFCF